VLAILWDPHRPTDPAPGWSAVARLLFGPKPSVADYFQEISGGRMRLESAGVLGWYDALYPAAHYWGTCRQPYDQEDLSEDRNNNCQLDPGEDLNANGILDGPDGILQPDEDLNHNGVLDVDLNNDGWIHGHVEKWAEAIRHADPQFNFAAYDVNGDGYLSPDELAILIVIPQNSSFGTERGAVGREVPLQDLIVDGVKIGCITEAYIGAPPSLGTVAHELCHLVLSAADMYFDNFYPYAAGPYSIMDQSPDSPEHLDPLHKVRLGWLTPRVVESSGWYCLGDIETWQDALVLYDPLRNTKEYFLVENRWGGSSYDRVLPYDGLAVWHMIEDAAVYGTLPAPAGVDPVMWNSIPAWDWGRRAMRMIRPIYGPPYNIQMWDGSSALTGYDLLSVDSNPNHVTLKWADGTPSGFTIQCMPVPASEVLVGITVPWDNSALPGPQLTIYRSGLNVIINWPAGYACFVLEETSQLGPLASWSSVGVVPQLIGDERVVTLPIGSGNKFYRLHKQ
jgi:M6 family metalloprotease-like protein